VETHDIQQFILFCSEMTNGSVHNILVYMKRFYNYLNNVREMPNDGSILMYCSVIRENKIQKHLSWNEITKILEQVDRSTDAGKRNYAIILLAVRTGLRAIDITNLRLTDIDWRNGTLQVMQQKTGLPVILPLIKDAGEAIKEYVLKARPKCESDYIFTKVNAPYTQLSVSDSVIGMFKVYQSKAGIERKPNDGKGFHALRRSMGRHMASAGVPVTTIAQVLGQSTVNATKQYISFDSENYKNCALDFYDIEVERSTM
jgi:integrase